MFIVKHICEAETKVFKNNLNESKSFGNLTKSGNFYGVKSSESFLSTGFKSKFSSYDKFKQYQLMPVSNVVKCFALLGSMKIKKLKWHTFKMEPKNFLVQIKCFFGYKLKITRKFYEKSAFKVGSNSSSAFGFHTLDSPI